MRTDSSVTSTDLRDAKFDLLRTRLESEVACPAVIAITSSTSGDGKNVAARALAASISMAGYSALLLDTCLASSNAGSNRWTRGGTFEAEARRFVAERPSGTLTSLAFGDASLQKSTNQRDIQSAMALFRSSFDFVVAVTENADISSFARALLSVSDVILVAVRKGRRQKTADVHLSNLLAEIGVPFLGVVALEASTIGAAASDETPIVAGSGIVPTRNHGLLVDEDAQRREIAKVRVS